MTRAMERLHLSWARSRQVFGQRRVTEPSRFLAEIPEESLEKSGGLFRLPPRRGEAPPRWAPTRGGRAFGPEPVGVAANAPGGAGCATLSLAWGPCCGARATATTSKVTVSFPGVGAKKLVARFAGLEVV